MNRGRVATAAVALGAAIVVASGFLPWLRLGRTYTGFRLARLVGSTRDRSGPIPVWAAFVWYLLPALGAVTWIALFRGPRPGVRPVHLVLGLAMVLMTQVYLATAWQHGRIVPGEPVAAIGAALVLAGVLLHRSVR